MSASAEEVGEVPVDDIELYLKRLRDVVERLPLENRNTLQYVIAHLSRYLLHIVLVVLKNWFSFLILVLFFWFLFSFHEEATEALYIVRIRNRIVVVFLSFPFEFFF